MTQRDKEIRDKCLGSIFWTGWYLCGYRDISQVLHFALTVWFQNRIVAGHRLFLIMIPRDFYKSSLFGVAAVVWFLINDPNKVISYTMHNYKLALEKMDEAQGVFESKQMYRSFPALAVTSENKKMLSWKRGDGWTIPRDNMRGAPSVSCFGITAGATGGHWDVIIWDDVIKGDDAEAPAQMKCAMKKSKNVWFMLKKPDSL